MLFPDQLLQEIRVLVGVYCRDCVMTGASEGAATDKQMVVIGKSFHGSDSYASHAKLFMQGKGVFSSAFKRAPIENNREGNEARAGPDGTGEMIELHERLHCRLSTLNKFLLVHL